MLEVIKFFTKTHKFKSFKIKNHQDSFIKDDKKTS